MRESCDTCCKCTSYICIDQCHLSCFVVILIMHVVDHVQCVNIQLGQPLHHLIVTFHYFIVIQIFRSNRSVSRSYLCFCLLIYTTVDCIQQTFCKVCTSSEELDFLTCLCCRYTTADAVVIAPYRTHNVIVLILYRTCLYRNKRCILFEVFRKSLRIQNCQVRLRSRSHVL